MATRTDTIADADFDRGALDDPDFLRQLVERALQRFLEAEMTAHLGAARYTRARATATATSRARCTREWAP